MGWDWSSWKSGPSQRGQNPAQPQRGDSWGLNLGARLQKVLTRGRVLLLSRHFVFTSSLSAAPRELPEGGALGVIGALVPSNPSLCPPLPCAVSWGLRRGPWHCHCPDGKQERGLELLSCHRGKTSLPGAPGSRGHTRGRAASPATFIPKKPEAVPCWLRLFPKTEAAPLFSCSSQAVPARAGVSLSPSGARMRNFVLSLSCPTSPARFWADLGEVWPRLCSSQQAGGSCKQHRGKSRGNWGWESRWECGEGWPSTRCSSCSVPSADGTWWQCQRAQGSAEPFPAHPEPFSPGAARDNAVTASPPGFPWALFLFYQLLALPCRSQLPWECSQDVGGCSRLLPGSTSTAPGWVGGSPTS